MKSDRKFIGIIGLFLFVCTTIHSMVPAQSKQKYRRLFMITDRDSTDVGADLNDLMLSAFSQSAPIVITVSLLEQLILAKKNNFTTISSHPHYKSMVSDLGPILQDPHDKSLYKKIKSYKIGIKPLVLYQFFFLNKDWILFDIPNTSLLLFIPKKYLNSIAGISAITNTKDAGEKLGLFLQGMPIMLPSELSTLDHLASFEKSIDPYIKNKPKTFEPEHLAKLLQPTPIKDDTYEYSWNFCFQGHGNPETRFIMGIPDSAFEQVLALLNSHVRTNLLYYVTCYGGEMLHITAPYVKFKGIKDLHYIVVNGSTTDATVGGELFPPDAPLGIYKEIFMPLPALDYEEFFTLLDQEMLEKALKTITRPFSKNIPLIRFPGTEWFAASALDNVFVLSNVKNLAALIDSKEFKIKDKIALLIYPQTVVAPIHLDNEKPIEMIFMEPSSTHYLAQVTLKNFNNFFFKRFN